MASHNFTTYANTKVSVKNPWESKRDIAARNKGDSLLLVPRLSLLLVPRLSLLLVPRLSLLLVPRLSLLLVPRLSL
ncbi:hypothetical protein, partial [Microseira wollei]|uniref:hypothetical protein n=1 Tax=Microseira wollei TaxID=467598 RepID=UPI001CFE4858